MLPNSYLLAFLFSSLLFIHFVLSNPTLPEKEYVDDNVQIERNRHDFIFDLLESFSTQDNNNLVISPLSIKFALLSLAARTEVDARRKISSYLAWNLPNSENLRNFSTEFERKFNSSSGWRHSDSDYSQYSTILSIDFYNQHTLVADAGALKKGMIRSGFFEFPDNPEKVFEKPVSRKMFDLFKQTKLSPLGMMVNLPTYLNALMFKQEFLNTFTNMPSISTSASWGRYYSVDLTQNLPQYECSCLNLSIVRIPYRDPQYSLVLAQPNKLNQSIRELVKQLNGTVLEYYLAQLDNPENISPLNLTIPQLVVSNNLDLSPVLEKHLNLSTFKLYDETSKLNLLHARQDSMFSSVVPKWFSKQFIDSQSRSFENPRQFSIDRPFLFFIIAKIQPSEFELKNCYSEICKKDRDEVMLAGYVSRPERKIRWNQDETDSETDLDD